MVIINHALFILLFYEIFVTYRFILLCRYDEYGEGRTSASNSDQTGTLSRNSYHGSDPDQYPDLLDIPNRYRYIFRAEIIIEIFYFYLLPSNLVDDKRCPQLKN